MISVLNHFIRIVYFNLIFSKLIPNYVFKKGFIILLFFSHFLSVIYSINWLYSLLIGGNFISSELNGIQNLNVLRGNWY
jgi:hypothetical protein